MTITKLSRYVTYETIKFCCVGGCQLLCNREGEVFYVMVSGPLLLPLLKSKYTDNLFFRLSPLPCPCNKRAHTYIQPLSDHSYYPADWTDRG